jgi:SAM-dependent methyltransferase
MRAGVDYETVSPNPTSPTSQERHDQALAAFEAGQAEAAFAMMRAAIGAELDLERLNDLAVIAQALGRTGDARAVFQAALVIDPDRDDVTENLAALERHEVGRAAVAHHPTQSPAPMAARPTADVTALKGRSELAYWQDRKRIEGQLSNDHYEFLYTEHFGLPREFFDGKRMLDVGCGPRGSLEWAVTARQRVGLDPLAALYAELGTSAHAMEYVASGAEHIPFADGHFDVVTTVNSLDHVEDLDATIAELMRVLRPGGTLLLLTDVNHDPTPCEPHNISWDIVDAFMCDLRVVDQRHFEKDAVSMLTSLRTAQPYDHLQPQRRYGILSVRFEKDAAGASTESALPVL